MIRPSLALALSLSVGCGLTELTIPSTRTVQAVTALALDAPMMAATLSTLALDFAGLVALQCPSVTPATRGASDYAFDYGAGCAPDPALLASAQTSGRGTVSQSGGQQTITFDDLAVGDGHLHGPLTAVVSGDGAQRTMTLSGTLDGEFADRAVELQLSAFSLTATRSGTNLSLRVAGAIKATDARGAFTLSTAGLQLSRGSITGTATLSLSGHYISVSADLAFTSVSGGVRVTTSIAGIPIEFTYGS